MRRLGSIFCGFLAIFLPVGCAAPQVAIKASEHSQTSPRNEARHVSRSTRVLHNRNALKHSLLQLMSLSLDTWGSKTSNFQKDDALLNLSATHFFKVHTNSDHIREHIHRATQLSLRSETASPNQLTLAICLIMLLLILLAVIFGTLGDGDGPETIAKDRESIARGDRADSVITLLDTPKEDTWYQSTLPNQQARGAYPVSPPSKTGSLPLLAPTPEGSAGVDAGSSVQKLESRDRSLGHTMIAGLVEHMAASGSPMSGHAVPLQAATGGSGSPVIGYTMPVGMSVQESDDVAPAAAAVCDCGAVFSDDALFCPKCGLARSQVQVPAREKVPVEEVEFSDGSWARAYREATGQRREALELLFRCNIISTQEFLYSRVSSEHIDECVWIGTYMLRMKPLEDWELLWQQAQHTFEDSVTACFTARTDARSTGYGPMSTHAPQSGTLSGTLPYSGNLEYNEQAFDVDPENPYTTRSSLVLPSETNITSAVASPTTEFKDMSARGADDLLIEDRSLAGERMLRESSSAQRMLSPMILRCREIVEAPPQEGVPASRSAVVRNPSSATTVPASRQQSVVIETTLAAPTLPASRDPSEPAFPARAQESGGALRTKPLASAPSSEKIGESLSQLLPSVSVATSLQAGTGSVEDAPDVEKPIIQTLLSSSQPSAPGVGSSTFSPPRASVEAVPRTLAPTQSLGTSRSPRRAVVEAMPRSVPLARPSGMPSQVNTQAQAEQRLEELKGQFQALSSRRSSAGSSTGHSTPPGAARSGTGQSTPPGTAAPRVPIAGPGKTGANTSAPFSAHFAARSQEYLPAAYSPTGSLIRGRSGSSLRASAATMPPQPPESQM